VYILIINNFRSVDSRRRNSHNSAVVSRFELRFPSRFGGQTLERAAAEIIEEEEYHSTKNDRTVNYRKCICPFVLGIVLMFTGIALRKFLYFDNNLVIKKLNSKWGG
jgi:hypothetical protein